MNYDKVIAGCSPVAFGILAFFGLWISLLVPLLLFYLSRRLGLDVTRSINTSIIDVVITIVLGALLIGLLLSSFRLVALDMEIEKFDQAITTLKLMVRPILTIYFLIAIGSYSLAGFLGRQERLLINLAFFNKPRIKSFKEPLKN